MECAVVQVGKRLLNREVSALGIDIEDFVRSGLRRRFGRERILRRRR